MNLAQPQLHLEAAEAPGVGCNLGDLNEAKRLLRHHAWQVEQRINDRSIRWVFNIASKYATKQEYRFYVPVLQALGAGRELPKLTLAQVLDDILGPKLVLAGPDVYAALNCSHGHFMNLAEERAVKVLNGALAGKHIHYRVEAASVRAFLERGLVA